MLTLSHTTLIHSWPSVFCILDWGLSGNSQSLAPMLDQKSFSLANLCLVDASVVADGKLSSGIA